MRRSIAIVSSLGVGLSILAASQGARADDPRALAVASAAEHAPRADYGADENNYISYVARDSGSNCGGDPSCDIDFTSFSVSRSLPNEVLVVVAMAGPTDAEMSNNDNGGLWIDIDADDDPSLFEYSAVTRWMTYPADEFVSSTLQRWDGSEWQQTEISVDFIRSDDYWGAVIPWREMGISGAAFRVTAINAAGASDRSPASGLTPYLPIKDAVDGPDGLVAPEITNVSYKKKGKKAAATVTWGKVSGASNYEVRWSLNGKKWTNWRTVKATRVVIKGLLKNKQTRLEIRGVDPSGSGPASSDIIGWGSAFGM